LSSVLPIRCTDDKPAEPVHLQVERLPSGAGWLLITAGVVGLIVPGVPGTPFLLAGAIVLTPGGSRLKRDGGPKAARSSVSRCAKSSRFLDGFNAASRGGMGCR
jgi:hypothetical protein